MNWVKSNCSASPTACSARMAAMTPVTQFCSGSGTTSSVARIRSSDQLLGNLSDHHLAKETTAVVGVDSNLGSKVSVTVRIEILMGNRIEYHHVGYVKGGVVCAFGLLGCDEDAPMEGRVIQSRSIVRVTRRLLLMFSAGQSGDVLVQWGDKSLNT